MLVIYLLLVIYLSLNSKFTLFTTCSVMLGLGFWKLYFPDFFASCFSAHPASWQQQIHPKGDQSWGFIGRTDVEPETPVLWSPDAKS